MSTASNGNRGEPPPPAVSLRDYMEAEIRAVRAEMQAKLDAAEHLNVERYGRLCDGLKAQEHAGQIAMAAADKAVSKAEDASTKRFESVNEFRDTLRDQAAQLMPRAEAEQRLNDNAGKIDALAQRIDRSEGKAGGYAGMWGLIAGGLGAVGVLCGIFAVVWTVTHTAPAK